MVFGRGFPARVLTRTRCMHECARVLLETKINVDLLILEISVSDVSDAEGASHLLFLFFLLDLDLL